MSIKKEKSNIIISIAMLIFVIMTSSIIQIAEYQLQKHDDLVKLRLLQLSEKRDVISSYNSNIIKAYAEKIAVMLGSELIPPPEEYINSTEMTRFPETRELLSALRNKEIDAQQYIYELIELKNNKIDELQRDYIIKMKFVYNLIDGTPTIFGIKWEIIRRLFYIIQIASIAVLFFLYIRLYQSIGNRYLTRIENENVKLKIKLEEFKSV